MCSEIRFDKISNIIQSEGSQNTDMIIMGEEEGW